MSQKSDIFLKNRKYSGVVNFVTSIRQNFAAIWSQTKILVSRIIYSSRSADCAHLWMQKQNIWGYVYTSLDENMSWDTQSIHLTLRLWYCNFQNPMIFYFASKDALNQQISRSRWILIPQFLCNSKQSRSSDRQKSQKCIPPRHFALVTSHSSQHLISSGELWIQCMIFRKNLFFLAVAEHFGDVLEIYTVFDANFFEDALLTRR